MRNKPFESRLAQGVVAYPLPNATHTQNRNGYSETVPAEYRNATSGGDGRCRIKPPGKPKPRSKHLKPILWQETYSVIRGCLWRTDTETGGTKTKGQLVEGFEKEFKDSFIESAIDQLLISAYLPSSLLTRLERVLMLRQEDIPTAVEARKAFVRRILLKEYVIAADPDLTREAKGFPISLAFALVLSDIREEEKERQKAKKKAKYAQKKEK